MAKTYIVAPNYTTRPPATQYGDEAEGAVSPHKASSQGALLLGDILRDPLGPKILALNRSDRIEIDRKLLVLPFDKKPSFKQTREDTLSGRFGIWASLLATLGLPCGVDAGLFAERHSKDVISADTLETHEFEPDNAFIDKSMRLESIKQYLEDCQDPPPPLYMVTGLKVVIGASLESDTTKKFEAGVGPQLPTADTKKIIEFTKNRTEGESWKNSTPFVLAFRVEKILYEKGKWTHTLSQKGASMKDGGQPLKAEIQTQGLGEDAPDKSLLLEEELYEYHERDERGDGDGINWLIANTAGW